MLMHMRTTLNVDDSLLRNAARLRKRGEILSMLKALPQVHLLEHEEVLGFLEARRLYGRDIGWADAHLLASTLPKGASFEPSTSRSGEQRLL
jgi:hypothetical protein